MVGETDNRHLAAKLCFGTSFRATNKDCDSFDAGKSDGFSLVHTCLHKSKLLRTCHYSMGIDTAE